MIRSFLAVAGLACVGWVGLCAAGDRTRGAAEGVGPGEVARCVEEAKGAAGRVRFAIDRARAWEAVAEVQGWARDGVGMRGSFAEALRAVGGYDDMWGRPQAYEELAWGQWRLGEKEGARRTLARGARETGGISAVRPRFFWTYRMAMEQSQMGDAAAAEVTWNVARKMKREESKSELGAWEVGGYAAALAGAWKIDEARAVAAEIKDDLGSSNAWEGIARAYIAQGDLKAAEALLPKMRFDLDAERIRARIAEVKIRGGETQAAKALAAGKKTGLYESEAWLTVVREKLKAGDVAGAIEAAGVVGEPKDRVTALAAIVTALVNRGDMENARKLAAEAAREALQVDFPDYMGEVFCTAARAQSVAGDPAGARASLERLRREAEKLDEKDWRGDGPRKWEMMRRIAEAQAGMGEFLAAEMTVETMERDDNDRERAGASRAVARAVAKAYGFEEAARWARSLTPEMVKCFAWVGAAEGVKGMDN